MESELDVEVYICPKCKEPFPNISNSAPSKDGELCLGCFMNESSKDKVN